MDDGTLHSALPGRALQARGCARPHVDGLGSFFSGGEGGSFFSYHGMFGKA